MRIEVLRADLVAVDPGGEVQVVGERHAGQAGRQRLLATAHHRRLPGRVPRPLGVHVAVYGGRPAFAGRGVLLRRGHGRIGPPRIGADAGSLLSLSRPWTSTGALVS